MNYENQLKEIVNNDDRYVVMTSENRVAIRNLPDILGERFIDTGISEQAMIGVASGLALRGRVPVVHALAAFLTMRAYEFIRTDIGVAGLPVKLVGSVAGFLSEANGPTHQALEDIALMRVIPDMNIFCPADAEDMFLGLETVLEYPGPYYIRFNNCEPVVKHKKIFHPGKAEIFGDGNDVTILVYGMLFGEAYKAGKILESEGISVRILNLRTIKPIDESAILKAAKETSLIVTLEDHFLAGGLFSIVSEILVKNQLRIKVLPLGLDNKWFKPAMLKDVLQYEKFDSESIALKIKSSIEAINQKNTIWVG